MNDKKLNNSELKASNQMNVQQSQEGASEPSYVTISFTPIDSPKLMPVILTFALTVTATLGLGFYEGQATEGSPRAVTNYSAHPTLPTLAETKEYQPLTLEQIKSYAEAHDETYMDTVIRFLTESVEQVDTHRLSIKLQEVTAEYTSKGYSLPASFLERVALNRMYKEIMHLATGNYTYKTIREEVAERVPLYTTYFVLVNENEDNVILAEIDEILREESTVQAIEQRLKSANLWGKVQGSLSYNTPNYMEDSFTEITAVDLGETIVNSYHNYVAKLMSHEPVTEESLLKMYIDYLDYSDYTEVVTIYAEMLPKPYSLDEELRAILHEPTEAYTGFLAQQS